MKTKNKVGRPKGAKNKETIFKSETYKELYNVINELHHATKGKEDQFYLGFRQALKEIGFRIYLMQK